MSSQLFIINHLEYADKNNIAKQSTPFEITDGIYTDLNTAFKELEAIYYDILEFNTDDDGTQNDSNFRELQYKISVNNLVDDQYVKDKKYYKLRATTNVELVEIKPINK
jgi:hypothetical protein